MSTQKRAGDYHVSTHLRGSFKDGSWHCAHGHRAEEAKAGPRSNYYMMRYWKCDPRKRGVNDENCRFWLWEDHLPEAMKYHGVPEGAIQMTSPYKRKRDGDIRDWARTPRTLRTRDAMVDREDSLSGLYDTPTPSPREEMGHRSRDESPTPMPSRRRARGAPSPSTVAAEKDDEREASQQVTPPIVPTDLHSSHSSCTLQASHSQQDFLSQILSTSSLQESQVALHPLPNPAPAAALAPPPQIQPETPQRRPTGRRLFETPGEPGRLEDASPLTTGVRRLVTPELDAYNTVIKALAGANVKLSLRGQNTLREIIREDAYTMIRNG